MMKHQRSPLFAAVVSGVLASLALCADAAAQFGPIIDLPPGLPTLEPLPPPTGFPPTVAPTATGTYLALPARTQTLAPNVRFVILSNFSSDAVLDRETGLVWARRNQTGIRPHTAHFACRQVEVGNRKGWRLPTSAELQSLVDTSRPVVAGQPRLPVGHPFQLSPTGGRAAHWVAETAILFRDTSQTTTSTFRAVVALDDGSFAEYRDVLHSAVPDTGPFYGVLCVRTGSLSEGGRM